MALAVSAVLAAVLAAGSKPDLAFLEKNREALDLSDGGAHFQARLLDTAGRKIILMGESHGVALSEDLDLALLRYLHKTAGVRVYLAEASYSEGCFLNRYLENGDEELLDYLMHQFQGSIAWTKEHRAFYANLRRWNLTLPEKERVYFVGVDVEHQRPVGLRYLAELVKPDVPAAIAETVAKLRQGAGEPALIADLASSLAAHPAEYAALLGDRLFEFEIVTANLQKAVEYYAGHGSKESNALRERVMYETFLKVYPRLGGAVCYGRWGAAHVLQRPAEGTDRFATMLNRPDSPVAGKVLSIMPGYQDSESLSMPGYHPAHMQPGVMQPFAPAANAPVTLFRMPAGVPLGSVVPAGSVQYVVFLKNATACHPLEEVPQGTPPLVVRTVPENGSKDVSPDVSEIRVTFSKDMADRSWAWCTVDNVPFPNLDNLHYDADRRTAVARVKLEPGRKYAIWLNTERYTGFRDTTGIPSVPYYWEFQTAARPR
jgi:hypothetical protein